MLIIGHRGAAGLAPENTLESLRAAVIAGADIVEFDVRLTKDDVPVLFHNPVVNRKLIRSLTFTQLQEIAPVTTLQDVLDEFFGKVLLNIHVKQYIAVPSIFRMIDLYITHANDWDNVLFSSFRVKTLQALKDKNVNVNLALLHHVNPFAFMLHHKRLEFAAVGFHRLHVNTIALAVAKELGVFTFAYTVDCPETARRLAIRGVEGVVTNYPDRVAAGLQADA